MATQAVSKHKPITFATRFQVFLHAVMFVLGMTTIIVFVFGGATTIFGRLLYDARDWITRIGGLVVIMGFVDDRWGMGALSKLAGQVAAVAHERGVPAGGWVLAGMRTAELADVFDLPVPPRNECTEITFDIACLLE